VKILSGKGAAFTVLMELKLRELGIEV